MAIKKCGAVRSSELVKKLGLSTKTIYKHLGILSDHGLIQKTGETPRVFYSVKYDLSGTSVVRDQAVTTVVDVDFKNQFAREAERIVRKIQSAYRPEKIIRFGSSAAGHITPDSDLDLFIIKDTNKPRRERHREVSRLILDRRLPVDIIVYTPAELKKRKKAGDFFINDILVNGRVEYEKK